MSENENIKYPRKSEKYKGVFQRKDGSWFYRIKKVLAKGDDPWIYQKSGFDTEENAHRARINRIRLEQFSTGFADGISSISDNTFDNIFNQFLDSCNSESSKKKYKALYDAQLSIWADRDICSINEAEIDALLLKLALKTQHNGKGYSTSYQASVRKLIRLIFRFAHSINSDVAGNIAQHLNTQPYKLRVLSLFSGIGAPEQALKNLGIDYELVNFCEIDEKAALAYCLLHNIDWKQEKNALNPTPKNLWDITAVQSNVIYDYIPNFDIMFFGFPCTDISTAGKQKGLSDMFPSALDTFFGETGKLTRSGLFFEAMRIALNKKPKFMIAENVGALVSKTFKADFQNMLTLIKDAGYNIYFDKLNSKKYGLPQSRPRVFMVMIREDLNIDFSFPEPIPLTVKAEDWFEENVADEYYLSPETIKKFNNYKSYKPNYKKDVIRCITTKWGALSHSEQTFVKDNKGIRVLTSEELMKFQGFPREYGTILRKNGFSRNQVGKLVGNSISVPVIQAIIKNLIDAI